MRGVQALPFRGLPQSFEVATARSSHSGLEFSADDLGGRAPALHGARCGDYRIEPSINGTALASRLAAKWFAEPPNFQLGVTPFQA